MADETNLMKLPVKLTDFEVQARAHEAAELMFELDADKDAEAERRKTWRADYETRDRRLRELSRSVRERTEHRPVEVDEYPSAGRGIIEIVRRDTSAVVYSRPMTDAEKRMAAQSTLWNEEPPTVTTTVGKSEPATS